MLDRHVKQTFHHTLTECGSLTWVFLPYLPTFWFHEVCERYGKVVMKGLTSWNKIKSSPKRRTIPVQALMSETSWTDWKQTFGKVYSVEFSLPRTRVCWVCTSSSLRPFHSIRFSGMNSETSTRTHGFWNPRNQPTTRRIGESHWVRIHSHCPRPIPRQTPRTNTQPNGNLCCHLSLCSVIT